VDISAFSSYPQEEEVLLLPGAKLQIRTVVREGARGLTQATLEEVSHVFLNPAPEAAEIVGKGEGREQKNRGDSGLCEGSVLRRVWRRQHNAKAAEVAGQTQEIGIILVDLRQRMERANFRLELERQ
jgi:hypothetical protein